MDFNISEQAMENIFSLIDKLDSSRVDELTLESSTEAGSARITLRKSAPQAVQAAAAPVSVAVAQNAPPQAAETPVPDGTQVRSQLVGVFYASSSPEAEPFVTVGQRVKKGDVLCIIEAMKVLNEIESDLDGTVEQICVKNGEMVEFGQLLFVVR